VLRMRLATTLEEGSWKGALATFASRGWARLSAACVARPVSWSRGRVITVGGATLGGSGRTPLALACVKLLAEAGTQVALVGHAYRASPGRARWVGPHDPVAAVGDEALACARALREVAGAGGAGVVVGPTRQGALDAALARADVAVLDGPVQLAPRKADLALLAVDARAPWGSGACPPSGDLRAPVAALLASTDRIVRIGDGDAAATIASNGAHLRGRLLTWAELRGHRIGLVTSLARPRRVLEHLARHGISPVTFIPTPDHAAPSRRARARAAQARDVDLWLCSAKCSVHLENAGDELAGRPVAVLEYAIILDPQLASEVKAVGTPHP
jgi:tetraacyldisaccharide-1-P 4'-kinase